ncbi:hypothetical protein [Streptomyces sp. NPDC024089]|uniref:hypothetical protein n=1 Tax=Streptomyces sp. NPDC024089 TaxID=3154328 RepID=UPI00340320D2
MHTIFDQFTRRISDITAQLTTLGIPLTTPAAPPAAPGSTDPWASSHPVPVDRSTLAWCTAVTMLADMAAPSLTLIPIAALVDAVGLPTPTEDSAAG